MKDTTVPPVSLPERGNTKKWLLGYQSFLAALTACGDHGEPHKALAILKIMFAKGLPMTTECWNCAIHGVSNYTCLYVYISVCLTVYLSVCPSSHLYVYLFIYLFIY
jgi:hypothetical protein